MKQMGIGLQMYTLRAETANDFEGTLREVAKLGYQGVEFAGYGGLSAEQLRNLLQELNLKAIGSHVSVSNLQERLEEEIQMNLAIGSQYIVCPYLSEDMYTVRENYEQIIQLFVRASEICKQAGIQFAYHNHAFEFQHKIDDQFLFDAIFSATSPELVQVEMDVCWVQFGGQNPLAYMQAYKDRLPLIHLKDYRPLSEGQAETVVLGEGIVDLPAVIDAAMNADVKWMIVEQDHCQRSPLTSVSDSMEWLKTHYLSRF
jgi:sugar phosphate isomerase/epimerase